MVSFFRKKKKKKKIYCEYVSEALLITIFCGVVKKLLWGVGVGGGRGRMLRLRKT